MFQKLCNHLSYANVAATLALVFALTGGAFAASSRSGGGSPAKATVSVTPVAATTAKKKAKAPARGPAGPKGATGAAGATGATGPAGATGPSGAQGSAGPNGTNGTNGEPGKEGTPGKEGESVKSKAYTGSECPEGGSEFKVGAKTPTYACNGEKGVIHPGETLAPEASETGAWTAGVVTLGTPLPVGDVLLVPVASFTIPLGKPLGELEVHYVNPAGEEVIENGGRTVQPPLAGCPGKAAKPEATPGNFCVYAEREEGVVSGSVNIHQPGTPLIEGAGTTGAVEDFKVTGTQQPESFGTWAVTAPAAP
jgi:hypothetical protein